MAVTITINGTNWTSKIGDLSVEVKENKKTEGNIKGDAMTIAPRSAVSGKSIKTQLFYLTRADYLTLKALYDAGAPVALAFTNLDAPSGNYIIQELSMQILKVLTGYAYNLALTFQQDLAPQLPIPATPTKPLIQAAVPNKLGW